MTTNTHEEQALTGQSPASQDAASAVPEIPVGDDVLNETHPAGDLVSAAEAPTPPTLSVGKIPPTMEEVPEDMPADDPSKYSGYKWPETPNRYVTEVAPAFHEADDAQKKDPFAVASLPLDATTFNSLMEAYPSINYQVGQPNRDWANEIATGARLLHQGEFLAKAVGRDGSKWTQRVPYATTDIGIMRPPMSRSSDGMLSGDLAALRTRMELGLGTATMVPLWHSGFWVTLRAPSAAARLEFQNRIDQERIELGRMTSGLAFSNTSVYIKSYLADFALAHMSTANTRYGAPLELKDKILCTDLPQLIWGLLTTLYPHGYPYHQPCINDPSKCQHIAKSILDLNKISFTDMLRLTEAQKKHMSTRTERKEDQALELYRNDHSYNSKGLIEISTRYGSIKMQLKVPTINEYASAGFEWVDGIANTIQQAFGSTVQGEARNALILDRAKMLSMGEYSHWVKEIGFKDGHVISDLDTIRNTLAEISGDPELSADFFTKVLAFIEECTLSLIALPRFNCPECGTPSVPPEMAKHPYLNPIDVEALFFTMQGQHIAKGLS